MAWNDIPKGELLSRMKELFEGRLVTESRSPAGNWLGFTLDKIEKGHSVLSLTVKKEMTNPYGNIHGGMMSLVIDEAIGWAVVSLDAENHYTSLTLNVDFLYAAHEGEQIRVEAVVLRTGKKIINVECHVYNMAGQPLARANSNLIVTGMQLVNG